MSSNSENPEGLDDLKEKLNKLVKKPQSTKYNSSFSASTIAIELVSGIIAGLIAGIILGNIFNHKRVWIIICLIIGFTAGFKTCIMKLKKL